MLPGHLRPNALSIWQRRLARSTVESVQETAVRRAEVYPRARKDTQWLQHRFCAYVGGLLMFAQPEEEPTIKVCTSLEAPRLKISRIPLYRQPEEEQAEEPLGPKSIRPSVERYVRGFLMSPICRYHSPSYARDG